MVRGGPRSRICFRSPTLTVCSFAAHRAYLLVFVSIAHHCNALQSPPLPIFVSWTDYPWSWVPSLGTPGLGMLGLVTPGLGGLSTPGLGILVWNDRLKPSTSLTDCKKPTGMEPLGGYPQSSYPGCISLKPCLNP